MPREVDDTATRKALARIRRAKAAVERAIAKSDDQDAASAAQAELTDWETEFMASVEQRLNEYGSAYADPSLGGDGEALSRLQLAKLKEIEKKAKGKSAKGFQRGSSFKSKGSGFGRKTPTRPRGRDINEDIEDEGESHAAPDPIAELTQTGAVRKGFGVVEGGAGEDTPKEGGAPRLRIIDGGKDE